MCSKVLLRFSNRLIVSWGSYGILSSIRLSFVCEYVNVIVDDMFIRIILEKNKHLLSYQFEIDKLLALARKLNEGLLQ